MRDSKKLESFLKEKEIKNKQLDFLRNLKTEVEVNITSGGVDSMEKYKYIIGQINAFEATKQEISNLLEDKEQKNETKGTVIDIRSKDHNAE
jgi:hypothetical protein